jgi:hypothetical protein
MTKSSNKIFECWVCFTIKKVSWNKEILSFSLSLSRLSLSIFGAKFQTQKKEKAVQHWLKILIQKKRGGKKNKPKKNWT